MYPGDNINSSSEFSKELNELQQLRLDMTKELRLMREDLRQAVTQNASNNQVI